MKASMTATMMGTQTRRKEIKAVTTQPGGGNAERRDVLTLWAALSYALI